ncbi:MAG TPA: hypothetical protein DDZ80_08515 [Cyanobacteria bacterium UBA8803]|nr:hypothetical protein [Cyanobacteria bacterium UBA9273]HBL58544.1 hypothetical protein [Cyanobacteria bacterium UBA8803]
MSIDLTVPQNLSANAQFVQDQNGNISSLALGTENVGIGTTNPETKLDVHGVIRTWHKDHPEATWDNVQLWSEGERSYLVASGANQGLFIEAQDEGQNKTNVLIQPSGGNVGIGTTNPETKLDVRGIIRTWHKDNPGAPWDNLQLWSEDERSYLLASGANQGLFIEAQDEGQNKTNVILQSSGGKVGIGTIAPRNPLAIRAQGGAEELISFEDPQGNTKWHINQNIQGSGLNFVETGVADGRLFIQAGGNVGIGTLTPSATLDVNGSIKAKGLDLSGPLTISSGDLTLKDLPDASTAPAGANLEVLVVDKATGKVYIQ